MAAKRHCRGLLVAALAMVWGPGCAGAPKRLITIQAAARPLNAASRALIHGLGPCYRAALRRRPGLEVSARLTVEFRPDGRLRSFTLDADDLNATLRRCLRDRIARWHQPAGAEARLGPVTIRFHPVADPGAPPPRRAGDFLGARVWPESLPAATQAGDGGVGGRIAKVIRERVANLRYCYNRELIRQPGYRAAARISFTINAYGLPYRVRVKPARPGSLSQPMVSCLKQKVVQWHFFRLPVDVRYGPFTVRFARRR